MSDSNKHSKLAQSTTAQSKLTKPSTKQGHGPLWWVLTGLAAILIAVVTLLIIVLVTPVGRGFIAQLAINNVKLPDDMSLSVQDLTSVTLSSWSAQSVQLSQAKQPLLIVQDFDFRFTLNDLLKGELHISQLGANAIEVWPERFPAGEKSPELTIEQQRKKLEDTITMVTQQLKAAPISVRLDELKVDTLKVHGENPLEFGFAVQAAVGYKNLLAQAGLNLQMQQGPINALKLDLAFDKQQQLKLGLTVDSPTVDQAQGQPQDTESEPLQWQTQAQLALDLSQQPYELTISDTQVTAKVLAKEHSLGIAGQIDLVPNQADIKKLKIDGLKGFVSLTGKLAEDDVALNLEIAHLDLAQLLPDVEALTLGGQAMTSGSINQLNAQGFLTGEGQVENQNIIFNTDFNANPKQVSLKDLHASVGTALLLASGTYTIADQKAQGNIEAKEITTALVAKFGVTLPPDIEFALTNALVDVSAELATDDHPLLYNFKGSAKGFGRFQALPVELDAKVQGNQQSLALDGTQVVVNKTPIKVTGKVNTNEQKLDLEVHAKGLNQETLKGLNFELPPTAQFSQGLNSAITGTFESPQVSLSLNGKLGYEQLELFNRCKVNGNLSQIILKQCDFFDNKQKTKVVMNHTGTIKLEPLSIELDHGFNKLAVKSLLKVLPKETQAQLKASEFGLILSGKANTSIAMINDVIKVQKLTSDLSLGGDMYKQSIDGKVKFVVSDPLAIPQLSVDALNIKFGKSQFNLAGSYTPQKIDMQLDTHLKSADFTGLPFEVASSMNSMPSNLKINTQIKGNSLDPRLNGFINYNVEVDQLAKDGALDSIPFAVKAKLVRNPGQALRIEGDIRQDDRVESTFQVTTNGLAQALAQASGDQKVDPKTLFVESRGELDLDNLKVLISPALQDMGGQMTWQANYKNEQVKGLIEVSQGEYRHFTMGTYIKEITLKAKFDMEGLEVVTGSARDGENGQYKITGYLQNPMTLKSSTKKTDLKIRLTEAKLLDRPDITLSAGGAIDITNAQVGGEPGFLVKGKLAVQPLAVKLDQAQTSGVAELNTTYVKSLDGKVTKESKDSGLPPIKLDIVLNTEQQAFLRGKGIEAELGGKVEILGTVNKPQIDGFYKTLRGQADILGKRFVIETGELRLSDGQGILNLQAVHTNKGQRFIAKVTGGLQSPEVSLTSDPPMPEDETVSRLLFGKALSDVTAMQALRIAAAVRSLGTSGGLDPIASTRDLLGVDQVSVESEKNDSGGSDYKVGAGKYVSDRVYVEIERSSNATDPWQGRVQVDLTDNISIETSAQSDTGVSGIDVLWKRDY